MSTTVHRLQPMATKRLSIVAVHGNGGGAFRFSRLHRYWPQNIDFQALTLPGFASVPKDENLRHLSDFADVVYDAVQATEAPCVVLGHGIGGSIALEMVQHVTDNIAGLILHAPVGTRLASRWFPRLMSLPGAREGGRRLFASRLMRPAWKRLLFSRPVPVAFSDQFFHEYGQCQAFSQMFDLITSEWFNTLQPVHLPSALLWGERERVLSPDQMQDYERLLPGCLTVSKPNWDHFPMIEQPEDYATTIASLAQTLVKS